MAKNVTYETLKNITSDLKKDLECPICLDLVKNPFIMCGRGHLMCVECLNTLKACPTCQGELLVESPVCIKNLLEHLPQYCLYAVNGCEKIVEKGDDSHVKCCGFRQIKCRRCLKDVNAKDLYSHYNSKHTGTESILFEQESRNNIWYPNFSLMTKYSFHNLVNMFGHLFWLNVIYCNKKELLEITFDGIPIGEMKDNYYVNISFINGNFNFISTVKAHIPEETGQCGQGGSDRKNQVIMSVPKVMLSHFIQNGINGNLNIAKVFFFKD